MDFFTRQESARRRTWMLVVLFFVSLAGIIASAYLACTFIIQWAFADPETIDYKSIGRLVWNPELFAGVSAVISSIVFGGTAFKLVQLRQGGDKVAEMLGGRKVVPSSTQIHERRLLNIVEEMALASGVPVPPVYLITGQEQGINAFAAGYTMNDAVIGITETAMRGLKREELQGVVAHEFSHILNGDMRMNIRLMGILHGLLLLALIGRIMIRSSGSSRSRSSGKRGGGVAIILGLGLALIIIGYFGYFFGGLIKRAVSRQREYLADASAVQFTRNPSGLAGALKKIGGLMTGSSVKHERAEEFSHMFFADGIKRIFGAGSLFSTHPPLKHRVKILEPSFDGEFPMITLDNLESASRDEKKDVSPSVTVREKGRTFIRGSMMMGGDIAAHPENIVQKLGMIDAAGLDKAQHLLTDLPEDIIEMVRDPVGAQAVILALLLVKSNNEDSDAWVWIPTSLTDPVGRCFDKMNAIKPEQRLPLVEMAMPALRMLNRDQAEKFVSVMRQVIVSDLRVVFFEFAVSEMVTAGLRDVLGNRRQHIQYNSIEKLWSECIILLSMLAYAGHADRTGAHGAFDAAITRLGGKPADVPIRELNKMTMDDLSQALQKLLGASMTVRQKIIESALVCLMSDQRVTIEEMELFRAFSTTLEIPVPPDVMAAGSVSG